MVAAMAEIGYHVTTASKLQRYENTGAILPPVRFWPEYGLAEAWAKKTGREIILKIEVPHSHPMPDHIPARFTFGLVRTWERQ